MPLIPAKCTNCGGILEVDAAKEAAICPHCGSAFITEKAITNYNTYNQIHADTVIVQGEHQNFEIIGGELKAYHGAAVDVIVPDGVYEIGEKCFANMKIHSVVIPEGVECIGLCAFANCTNLRNIQLPESLKNIADSAFSGCASLEKISIPKGLQYLANSAFKNCISLSEISLPDSLQKLGDGFWTRVILEEEILSGSDLGGVFGGCSNLQSIRIPENIKKIEDGTFYGCQNLQSLQIPQSVEIIGKRAFYGCSGLRELSLPENLKCIDEEAFQDCKSLISVIFPESLSQMGYRAFYNCDSLENIQISEKLRRAGNFGKEAFRLCMKLKSVSPKLDFYKDASFIGNACGSPIYNNYERYYRLLQRRCLYCGGEFIGRINKKCKWCKKPKDYNQATITEAFKHIEL